MAEKINDGRPVFPYEIGTISKGITLRQYAAIKLRVPDSGTDWLDAMIVEAKRDELAAKAMQGLIAGTGIWAHDEDDSGLQKNACLIADAMLKAGRQQ